jgi:hypothetical protein
MRNPFKARLSTGLIIPSITISIVPLYPELPKTLLKIIERVLSIKVHCVLELYALIEHVGLVYGLVT